MPLASDSTPNQPSTSAWAVFFIFLRLGLSAFGGPVAHLAYFREAFVTQRRWYSERDYAELVALCQFLPGPASSQVGMAIGLSRAGYPGALAAWCGFTLPSALLLMCLALGLHQGSLLQNPGFLGVLQGLKLAAVAIVAQAVWGMGRQFCTTLPRFGLMLASAGLALMLPFAWGQAAILIVAGTVGRLCFQGYSHKPQGTLASPVGCKAGALWLLLFFVLLLGLPLLARLFPQQGFALLDAFYRAGALVFGGGHVVLPLLETAVVTPGWISSSTFLAGYGATQAVPGPLFTFSAFLGTDIAGVPGGTLCLLAIFTPSFLLLAGALPFWTKLQQHAGIQAALTGINAAVVGLLLAALYRPIGISTLHTQADLSIALMAIAALILWQRTPWQVVMACAFAGWGLSLL